MTDRGRALIEGLENIRDREGWSNKRLAAELGITGAYWCQLRSGKYPMTLLLARRVKAIFSELTEQANAFLIGDDHVA